MVVLLVSGNILNVLRERGTDNFRHLVQASSSLGKPIVSYPTGISGRPNIDTLISRSSFQSSIDFCSSVSHPVMNHIH